MSRRYPAQATEKQRREIDNMSELSAYAYGFSDKKPGLTYWIILAIMIAGSVHGCISHAPDLHMHVRKGGLSGTS